MDVFMNHLANLIQIGLCILGSSTDKAAVMSGALQSDSSHAENSSTELRMFPTEIPDVATGSYSVYNVG